MSDFRVRNVGWGLIAQIADKGAVVISTMILAKYLSQEAFAGYAFFQITITTMASLSALGVGAAAARFFALWYAGDSQALNLIAPLWFVCIATGLLFSIFGVATAYWWYPSSQELNAQMLIFGVFAIATGVVAHGGLLGMGLFKSAAFVSVASGIATLIGATYAAIHSSQEWAQFSLVAGASVATFLACSIVIRRIPLDQLLASSFPNLSGVISLGRFIGPLALVTLLAASGNWLLGRMLLNSTGSGAFAAFAIGLQWFSIVQLIPGLVARAGFPSIVKLAGRSVESHAQARGVVKITMYWTIGSAVLTAVAVTVLSQLLVQLYSGQIISSDVMIWFAVASIPTASVNTLGNALIANGRATTWLWMTVIWFGILMATGWLLRDHGANGAALSLMLAGAIQLLMSWRFVRQAGLI